jgi:ligand-binding sensor domain-containing protein
MHGGPFLGVVLAIAVDPNNPRIVYVAAHGGGVFQSTDQGGSWTVVNQGLPNKQVFSLALHPKEAGKIYLGTDQGIFVNDVRGTKWRSLSSDLGRRNIRAIAIDPTDPDGLYAATDQGVFLGNKNQWRRLSIGIANDDVRALAVSPGGTVFAGTFGGVYKKQKSDDRWQAASTGLSDNHVRVMALDPLSPEVIYAGTATSGVFKTVNGGKNWQEFNRGLLNSTVLSLIRVPLPDQPLMSAPSMGYSRVAVARISGNRSDRIYRLPSQPLPTIRNNLGNSTPAAADVCT